MLAKKKRAYRLLEAKNPWAPGIWRTTSHLMIRYIHHSMDLFGICISKEWRVICQCWNIAGSQSGEEIILNVAILDTSDTSFLHLHQIHRLTQLPVGYAIFTKLLANRKSHHLSLKLPESPYRTTILGCTCPRASIYAMQPRASLAEIWYLSKISNFWNHWKVPNG